MIQNRDAFCIHSCIILVACPDKNWIRFEGCSGERIRDHKYTYAHAVVRAVVGSSIYMYRHHRQTNRQTDKHTNIHAYVHAYIQTGRQAGRQAER